MMAYAEYKKSLYPFDRMIPSHWEETYLSRAYSLKSIPGHTDEDLLSVFLNKGVINYSDSDKKQVHKPSEDLSKYQLVEPGDFVMNNQQAWRGSVGVSKYRGIISPAYYVWTPRNDYNPNYMNYMFRDKDIVDQFVLASKGVGSIQRQIFVPYMKTTILAIPPREEQDQIVRYLNWQTSKINKLIHGYQREIQLLEERLQSKITFMVTHDRFSEGRKDSEIYWLTDVPENWRVTRLKHVLEKQDRPVLPNSELLICANSGEVKLRGDTKIGLVADNDDIYQGVAKGDLLIHGMDTWHGAIAISQYDGMCTPVVHVCTSNQSVRFICYYLRMMAFTKVFKAISNGVRQNTSDFRSWDKAGSLWIALPSVEEQEEIADILDNEVEKTKAEIVALKKQIELAKEYRTRLISDVVTGQMDVRGIEIPDYTPEDDIEDSEAENENVDEEVDADAE